MDSYEVGIDMIHLYLVAILNFKMDALNIYNPAFLRKYLRQKHENWHTYTLWYVYSFIWNLVSITTDMVSDRHLELTKKGHSENH